jgi:DNA-binding response OmpR family regulator
MKNILLVEDDAETTKLLQLHFHSQMYNLTCCISGNDAFSQINTIQFDLVILDIALPDMTGFEICKHLRDEGFGSPIIMLSSYAQEKDKVLAFELGADDYVTKPFGSLEFMSRIKALLRRAEQTGLETVGAKEKNCI